MRYNLFHISEGNSKTECFSFDLPPLKTCPGKTKECSHDCYALRLTRIYPKVDEKYERNLDLAKSQKFVRYMVKNIPANCQFRIHVSGDFYSVGYIRKWIRIVEARQDVTFYAYTRSWRKDAMVDALLELHHAHTNVNINLSVDDETGAPSIESLRWCYLTRIDSAPSWLRAEDIIFRSNHIGHKKRRKNAVARGEDKNKVAPLVKRLVGQVCPLEQGQDIPNFSCAKCRLCVDKPKVPQYAV